MKRIFLITILSVLIIPTGISQDLPSYVPVDGLVAFYPFNGNANDASGNGYHGTRFQVGDGLDRHGNQNQSLYFNGKTADGTNNQQIINDSYVKVDNFDYSFSTSSRENQISISFWVKNEWNNQINPNDGLPILSRRTNNNIDFDLSLSGSNYNPSNAPALHLGFWSEPSAQSVPDNSWAHCVVTCDGSNVKYYMQNQLYAEFSHNNGVISNNTSNLMIGKFSYQGGLLHHFFFNGWIDDLGIWNKSLTVEEISSLYNGSTSGGEILLNGVVRAENNQIKNVADPTDAQDAATKAYIDSLIADLQSQIDQINSSQPQYDLTDGLVAYYPFNGNANDASGNDINGTVSGATLTSNKNGDVNSAYSFDGDQDIITIPNTDMINTSQITVSAWIKPTRYTALEQDQGDSQQVIVSNTRQDGWGPGFEFKTFGETDSSGAQYLSLGLSGTINSNFSTQTDNIGMSLNQWSHVAYTHDDTNINFYLNGQLVLTEDSPGTNLYNNNSISIGSRPSIRHVFSGGIDDVGIWNEVLTAEEIEYLYSNPNFLE